MTICCKEWRWWPIPALPDVDSTRLFCSMLHSIILIATSSHPPPFPLPNRYYPTTPPVLRPPLTINSDQFDAKREREPKRARESRHSTSGGCGHKSPSTLPSIVCVRVCGCAEGVYACTRSSLPSSARACTQNTHARVRTDTSTNIDTPSARAPASSKQS